MLRKDGRFAKALATAMEHAGMTRAALARKIDVPHTTVQRWLNGREPSKANFQALIRVFPELDKFA